MSLADRIRAEQADPSPTAPHGAASAVVPVRSDDRIELAADAPVPSGRGVPAGVLQPILEELRTRLAEIPGTSTMASGELRRTVDDELVKVLSQLGRSSGQIEPASIRAAVLDEILGFGLLQDLLDDPAISEIMVNGIGDVFVETGGQVVRSTRRFDSESELIAVINRMVRSTGRRVDQTSPMVDGRLPDGSRLNVVLPPLAVDGPSVTIRKFTARSLTLDDLIASGSLSSAAAEFLRVAVEKRLNILVSGGTGTGKTTMLNFLSSSISRSHRVVTVEDAVELTLDMPNIVRLESRPPNIEGTGQITIRDLVRNALRMRPDRIVVGEVRGAEALDMLQAMNTGHEGSLSTLHANSARDALRRIETMVLFGEIELPLRAIREQMASAIDLIVQVARDASGFRYVKSITEVVGMESDVIALADIFARRRGADAESMLESAIPLSATGIRCGALDVAVLAGH
jgi:pilus assembly protein CpaF